MPASRSQWLADAGESGSVMTSIHIVQPGNRRPALKNLKLRTSCDTCQTAKVKCSQAKPVCSRCLQHGIKCIYSPVKRIGRPPKSSAEVPERSKTAAEGVEYPTARKTPSSNQEDVTRWPSDSMDVDFQYPTPQSLSCTLSDTNPRQILTDWENYSAGKSAESFSAVLQQGSGDGYGDLNKFFEDTSTALTSAYSATANPFDPLWDFSAEVNVEISPADSEVTSSLPFKALGTEVGDLSKPGNGIQFQQQSEFSGGLSGEASTRIGMERHEASAGQDGDVSRLFNFDMFKSLSRKSPALGSANDDSGQGGPEPPIPIATLSTDPCTAGCCQSLMKSLFQLSEGLTVTSGPPPLDVVLSIERETHLDKDRVLTCKSCLCNNRSSILLLTMVMERLVQVLEMGDRTVATTTTESTDRHGLARGFSMSGKRCQGQWDPYASSQLNPLLETECLLLIGDFEVNEATKRRFLKRLWKSQLRGLLAMLKDIEQAVKVDLRDINHRLAKEMTIDVRRRLESLTGRLEIWE
jgi:hypothetical protein